MHSLTPDQDKFLNALKLRFESNTKRHPKLSWNTVISRLLKHPQKIDSLMILEQTGGEPDVVQFDHKSNDIIFVDCSTQSPTGRRSYCYDKKAQQSRKNYPSKNNCEEFEHQVGGTILTAEEYNDLQEIEDFDTTTSSWLKTPEKIRKLGGAIFGDKRYETVFIYHNGADSYYASRAFRIKILI